MRSAATAALLLAFALPLAAQEVALKGGAAFSRFEIDGDTDFDEGMRGASLGGHLRFNFGPVALQPELHIVTRGASIGAAEEDETLRLEYLELPLLLVVPVDISSFEVYGMGGGMVAIESRCRFIFENDGLKTNVGCDPPRDPLFSRSVLDYGLVAGGGVSHELGGGRLLLEGRYTWGMNNIYDGPGSTQLHNRSLVLMIGYVLAWDRDPGL